MPYLLSGVLAASSPLRVLRGAVPPPEALCQITIKGGATSGISSASMRCTGAPVTLLVDKQLFVRYTHAFKGVDLLHQRASDCLLKFSGDRHAAIVDSFIQGVNSARLPQLNSALCASDNSILQVERMHIVHNKGVRGLDVQGRARVVLNASWIEGNTAQDGGAGIRALHNATVVVNGSKVANNLASDAAGGGIRGANNSIILIAGKSNIFNNTSFNTSGGDVARAVHCLDRQGLKWIRALPLQTTPVSSTTVAASLLQATVQCSSQVTAVWSVTLLEVQRLLEVALLPQAGRT